MVKILKAEVVDPEKNQVIDTMPGLVDIIFASIEAMEEYRIRFKEQTGNSLYLGYAEI